MASYTIELRNVCEIYGKNEVISWFTDYELSDFLSSEEIEQITQIGIWNKQKLAENIVEHYWMREIGLETPALFKHYAKVKMREIMEAKLPLIYSNSLKYDPLTNVDFMEDFKRNINNTQNSSGTSTNDGSSNSSSNQNGSSLQINSDTPQGQISKTNILKGNYATSTVANENSVNIQDNTTTSNSTKNDIDSTANTIESYSKHQKGNLGITSTYQALVKQFRNNIIAINRDIIYALNSLFMGLY